MANQRRSVEKEAYWRGQLDQQAVSGLSVRRWCRDNGVSEPTFYVWRRELRKRDLERDLPDRNPAEPGVQGRLSGAGVPSGFVAVDVVPSDVVTSDAVSSGREAQLEIDVAGGVVIRLRENASAETLERVLSVVCRHGVIPVVGSGSSAREREVRSC
jgi:transposase-like protein